MGRVVLKWRPEETRISNPSLLYINETLFSSLDPVSARPRRRLRDPRESRGHAAGSANRETPEFQSRALRSPMFPLLARKPAATFRH